MVEGIQVISLKREDLQHERRPYGRIWLEVIPGSQNVCQSSWPQQSSFCTVAVLKPGPRCVFDKNLL